MTQLHQQPSKRSWVLVRFHYGAEGSKTVKRFTDKTEDWDIIGPLDDSVSTYESVPDMRVDLGARTGGLDEDGVSISMPRTDAFIVRLSNGEPHAPTKVVISEVITDLGATEVYTRFRGEVGQVEANFQGRKERVSIEVENWKTTALNHRAGIQVNQRCERGFGAPGCFLGDKVNPQVNIETIKETGTITLVEQDRVTVSGISTNPKDKTFKRGWIRKDGLSIGIRIWKEGSTTFWLREAPPDDWDGTTVEVIPGCDHRYKTCNKVYKNRKRYLALGRMVPGHNPVFHNGGGA